MAEELLDTFVTEQVLVSMLTNEMAMNNNFHSNLSLMASSNVSLKMDYNYLELIHGMWSMMSLAHLHLMQHLL
jgi:hypothetical protein